MSELEYVKRCLQDGGAIRFYTRNRWKRLRAEVLREDRYECQLCKAKGKYRKATHVHHVKRLDEHPEYGLTKVLPDGKRNLLSVCRECHDALHPKQLERETEKPLTEERWD